MQTIYEYPLGVTSLEKIRTYKGATALCVQARNNTPCVWLLVDTDAPIADRTFVTYGTGFEIPIGEDGKHVGTYQLNGGAFVFHVFDLGEIY